MENSPVIFDRMPEFSRIGSFSFLFWAILIGIFLSAVVNMGPSFITLVQTSLHRGFRSAAWFVTGVILNDAMVIAICILASVQIVMNSSREAAFACIGAGLILLLFGIFTFRKKVQDQKARDEYIEQRANEAFSAVAMVAGNMGGNKVSTIVFFAIILGTTWFLELLKAWGAAKLKKFLDAERTTIMNRIAGVLLMLCGAYFIIFKGVINLL